MSDLVFKDKPVNPTNCNGWTPLHLAAANDQIEVWKLIADAMEDIDPEDDINPKGCMGRTPLHLATMKGHLEM